MEEEPDNLTLRLLREMRADMKAEFAHMSEILHDVRLHVGSLDMRVEALDEKVAMIREGTVSAIGFAANASRAHVELHKQIADLTRRVEKLEAAK